MRLATRTFLWSFPPSAVLLVAGFWAVQRLASSTVRDGVRRSLHQNQISLVRMGLKSENKNTRLLRAVGESAVLKAGLQLLRAEPGNRQAQRTVEEQLREICGDLGFDFLLASNPDGAPEAGVMHSGRGFAAMDMAGGRLPERGYYSVNGGTYYVTSVAVNQGEENLGMLSIGEHFDLSDYSTPVALFRNNRLLESGLTGIAGDELQRALYRCGWGTECELILPGGAYLALRMDALHLGDGYSLYSFQELEAAIAPVQARLEHVLAIAAGACLLAALALSAVSSRSIVKPIAKMDVYLRQAERTGTLPEFDGQGSRIREIRRLIQSFQRAAAAIRESRERLRRANLEFTASLASALDARDRYTAGHSERVSGFSCAIGKAMGMPAEAVEDLRIGALLHDIGKIGIADAVLQKPGKLSRDEFALIQAHPEIGCRILEGVHGFQAYLPIVGLHHENWDGSGYPRGLNGTDVPLGARIVHVADAFDAMTSDRPYRRGMSEPEATRALQQNAGTQFDPAIVRVFVELHLSSREQSATSLALLAQAVNEAGKHSLPVEGYVA